MSAATSVPGSLMKSPFDFQQHGQCGRWVSSVFPQLAACVDDIAFLRSCWCTSTIHAPAMYELHSGRTLMGYPSLGSWVTYGLGSQNQNLPGYVVLLDHRGGPISGPPNWASGFMPATYQGTILRSQGAPILDLQPPPGVSRDMQRKLLDTLGEYNRARTMNIKSVPAPRSGHSISR